MANTKISALAAGAAVSATDIFPNVQTAGVGPVKTTAAQNKTFMLALSTTDALTFGGSSALRYDAANTIALRNGTSAQTARVFGTFTDASNGDWLSLSKASAGDAAILSTASGTGTGGSLVFGVPVTAGAGVAATNVWKIGAGAAAGAWLAVTDNAYDIGASGANRPRNAFLAGYLITGGAISVSSGSAIGWGSRSQIYSSADGEVTLQNTAGTDFIRIVLGLRTASFPAIKRNGAAINFRLADDSADAAITAANVRAVPAATLPGTPTAGMIAAVTTATAPVAGSALTLGGSAYAIAWYNNAQWTVIAA